MHQHNIIRQTKETVTDNPLVGEYVHLRIVIYVINSEQKDARRGGRNGSA